MKRKVIQLAGKTLVVSLPSTWAKKYGITKGAEVEVSDTEHGLLISPPHASPPRSITLDVSGTSDATVKSLLSVVHKLGYDDVEVFYDRSTVVPVILDRITELIGFELIEQTPKRCMIKSVTVDSDQEVSNMLRRTFLITLEFAEQIQNGIEKGEDLHGLLHYEKTANRLTNYCHRLLHRQGQNPEKTFLYTIMWLLEKISDDYRDLCMTGVTTLPPPLLVCLVDVNRHLRDFYAFFYTKSLENIDLLRENNAALKERINSLVTHDASSRNVLFRLASVTQHIHDCFGSVTGLKMVRTFKIPTERRDLKSS